MDKTPITPEKTKYRPLLIFTLTVLSGLVCGFFFYISQSPEIRYSPFAREECQIHDQELLRPGYHFIDKPPFFVKIDPLLYGISTDKGTYYKVEQFEPITIPAGHYGEIRDLIFKDAPVDTIGPGRYRINRYCFEVQLKKK